MRRCSRPTFSSRSRILKARSWCSRRNSNSRLPRLITRGNPTASGDMDTPNMANISGRLEENGNGALSAEGRLAASVNTKLALLGYPPLSMSRDGGFMELALPLIARFRESERLLSHHLCPADQRILTFLYDYLQDVPVGRLPLRSMVLD